MLTLAFDTTCGIFSIAIADINNENLSCKVIAEYKSEIPNSQSQFLISKINELLTINNIPISHIDNLLVTKGPGSFTGVRLGLAAAYGLKASLPKLNLFGISTLEVIASKIIKTKDASNFKIALKAGLNEYYIQEFNNNKPVSEISIIKAEVAKALQIKGDNIIGIDEPILPAALDIVGFFSTLENRKWKAFESLEPLYIRNSYF